MCACVNACVCVFMWEGESERVWRMRLGVCFCAHAFVSLYLCVKVL